MDTAASDDILAEADLWTALKTHGSAKAREALFSRYTPLAIRIARSRMNRSGGSQIEIGDLRQLAYAGLLESIDRFDPARGAPFAAFAQARIDGSVVDGLSHMSEAREQAGFRKRVRAARAKSIAPANPSKLSADDALNALAEAAIGLAIGFMLDDTELVAGEDTPDRRPNAYDSLAWKEAVGRVVRAVDRLPERDRDMIRHHYFGGVEFEQIAKVLGLSKGRVSQLHRGALDRLRRELKAPPDFSLRR